MMKELRNRSAIDPQYCWNLADLYGSLEEWETAFARVTASLPGIRKFEGTLASPAAIAACFKALDAVSRDAEKLYFFAYLRHHEDTADSDRQGPVNRVDHLLIQVREAGSFIEPEILSNPVEQLTAWSGAPELNGYRFSMEKILRRKPHTLPKEQEAIMAQAGILTQIPSNVYSMVNDADMKFPSIRDETMTEVELTHARYSKFLESTDRRVRADAFAAHYSSYRRQQNTIASLFNANVQKDIFYRKIYGYRSSLAMGLFDDDIGERVYTNLIGTVRKFLPLFRRYLRLRSRILQLPELHPYDFAVPLVPELQWHPSYEEAAALVRSALKPLGAEYGRIVERALTERWIDVYESRGKHSGAYSWGVYDCHPYMLLNYEPTLNGVFTLAHEMGHAVHTHYSNAAQPYQYAGYSIAIAEIASTFNEALLLSHLLGTTTDRERRIYLLAHFLEGFRGTVIVQTLFAEFEMVVHTRAEQGEPLTLATLNEIYFGLHRDYYGDAAVLDREIEIGWMRIPHFYNSYYVYKYATGFCSAQALSQMVLTGPPDAADRYLAMLKSGGSDFPLALLKRAGLDLSTPEPIENAFGVYEAALAELERLNPGSSSGVRREM